MKRLLLQLFFPILALALFTTGCDKDDNNLVDGPSITATGTAAVQVGNTITLTFTVNAPGKIKDASVTASTGTATISSTGYEGQTNATINVSYTAPATSGIAEVTLTVNDEQDPAKSSSEDITVQITDTPQKTVVDVFASAEGVGTVTWTKDKIYVLRGFVFVNEGQTLTIEEGTVIKGQPGTGSGASALIVARGGRIEAEGTANEPIIFTALVDDVDNPMDLQPTQRGLWGGLIVLGKARINDPSGESAIEGIPTSEERGLYGGADDNDNSGILKYISIRHGGTEIGSGNEINGLSLGGVGRGTTIEHIEVFSNLDDGFEFFGGTVNAKYLISAYCGDDAIDWDQGYSGTIQHILVLQSDDEGGRGFESNGVVNDAAFDYNTAPIAIPTVANGTFFGNYNADGNGDLELMNLRQGSGGKFYNNIFYNFKEGVRIERVTGSEPIESETRLDNGDLLFRNNLFGKIGSRDSGAESTDLAGVGSASRDIKDKVTMHLATNGNQYNSSVGFMAYSNQPNGGLNPLLSAGSAGATMAPATGISGIEATTYIGGFGTTNWANGWTALGEYGFFQ